MNNGDKAYEIKEIGGQRSTKILVPRINEHYCIFGDILFVFHIPLQIFPLVYINHTPMAI
jgi:hypothetical protein